MNRKEFLTLGAAMAAGLALPAVGQAAPQPERLTTAARPITPEPLPLIEDDRDKTRQRLDSLARLLERAPLGGQVLYLDTETTGLAPTTNDLLEVAVVDESGAVLLDTLVRPRRRQAWPEAQAVHGIRPEDVATAPELATVAAQLAEVIEAADGLYVLQLNADGLENQADIIGAATDVIDSETVITP